MKKVIYIILILIPVWGCNDFLDEVSQSEIIPETTDHFAALLLGEFNHSANNDNILQEIHYMTDDMQERNGADAIHSKKKNNKTFYTWQREIEIDEDGIEIGGNKAWLKIYEDIAIANYVIEMIEDAVGSQGEINFIKGEAYFIRAFSYFNLLNLYGLPFSESGDGNMMGVPLRLNTGVERTYRRNTVTDCYEQIEADLDDALRLIEKSNITKSKWHPNVAACNLLMSRVKLYQQKWDEAITYSSKVLDENQLSVMNAGEAFVTHENDEILFSFFSGNNYWNENATYQVSQSFYHSYDSEDRRKQLFFKELESSTKEKYMWTTKYSQSFSTLGKANFRVAEALLNRAEAYAAKGGNAALAIEDIETLHKHRYATTSNIQYPGSDEEVLRYVLNERRKEFCFEEHHRWFDLRRMENRPEITHVYSVIDDAGNLLRTETFTLFNDDPNYTLPLPLEELENNQLIRNVERYEKFPETEEEIIIH